MDPLIAQAVAEARIADRHREAAARRRSRLAAPRPTLGLSLRNSWSSARSALTGRLAALAPVRATPPDPVCCAA